VREGLYPAVAVPRPSGTTAIIEDVTFPTDRLADAATDLRVLLEEHGYHDAIIYGHARDGNLHFVLNQAFLTPADTARYAGMMDAVAGLVLGKYDGALKAEHGTGRNVAPFVEQEWGGEAVGLMRRLKALCDPRGLLNPGVILPEHPRAHLDHLKALPPIEAEADRCIECGFCEKVCPSRELTLSPRQRIVVWRELARLRDEAGAGAAYRALLSEWEYAGLDTCAGDGLCETVCPMGIDTGALVKELRARAHPGWRRRAAAAAARHWAGVETVARGALRAGHALGPGAPAATRVLRRLFGEEWVPAWTADVPRAARPLPAADPAAPIAVYWPSCTLRILGPAAGRLSAPEAMLRVAERAGLPLRLPADLGGSCCGTPWHSKGLPEGQAVAAGRTFELLWRWSDEGRLPVVVEGTSCTHGLLASRMALPPEARERFGRLTVLDSVEWLHDVVLPRLPVPRRTARVAAHPTCAAWELGLVPALEGVARALGEEVLLPPIPTCCGFAGDRGFLRPELTASALAREAARLAESAPDLCVSSNRTCEIGLARATGRPWEALVVALEEATR
jgi:D-lactate dehydrogenase